MSTATATERVFNFSAGPATLPLKVLQEAQEHRMCLPGVGASILEISHRSPPFDAIIQGAEADMRSLLGIPDDYAVLFLQGGATTQFSMIPMNFLNAILERPANERPYLLLVVGYPAEHCRVPKITKKGLDEIMTLL